jgi:SAM-dependent methyltransferase
VIDVGCGCGDTALELARSVGRSGTVLGIDVSQPMLGVARARVHLGGWPHLMFREADASESESTSGPSTTRTDCGSLPTGTASLALPCLSSACTSSSAPPWLNA